LAQPRHLGHTVGHGAVLSLGTRAGDDELPLGRPGDKVVSQENNAAGRRVSRVRTTSPVSVGVDNKLGRRGSPEEKTEVECVAKVVKNPLDNGEVRLLGIMHINAHTVQHMKYLSE
jgi:hypothetical protein